MDKGNGVMKTITKKTWEWRNKMEDIENAVEEQVVTEDAGYSLSDLIDTEIDGNAWGDDVEINLTTTQAELLGSV